VLTAAAHPLKGQRCSELRAARSPGRARGWGRAFQPRGPSACVYSTRATAGASVLAAFGASVPSLPPHASVTRADIVGHLRARPGEGGDGRPGQRRRLSARQQSKRSRPLRRPVQAPPWLGAQPAGRAAQQRAWRGRGPHASSSTTTASASTPARRAARSKKSSTATASPLANCQTRTAPSAGAISRLPLQPPQPCP
jgi:hypothetical protein